MMEKRHYNNGEAEFMLDPVNDAVVKVTHRNQVGWIGISLDWDVQRPYTFTTSSAEISDDGLDGVVFRYSTPDEALKFLCTMLLDYQGREDSRRVNPEERKASAKRVLREFLNEQPE